MRVIIGIVFISIALIIGCSDDTTGPQNGKGELKVYMVDSPSVYDSVVVCISSVEAHKAGSSENSGWTVLNDSTRCFDLLQLSNGANVILGDKNLDEGHYTQIRLLITSDSYVVTQGIKVNLDIPSGI